MAAEAVAQQDVQRRTQNQSHRSLEELARLGWTKRKANKVLQMYSKWGYGFITMREAQRIVTGTPNLRSIR